MDFHATDDVTYETIFIQTYKIPTYKISNTKYDIKNHLNFHIQN